MKYLTFKHIALLLSVVLLSGCGFLDLDESYDYKKQDVLESYNRTKQLVTNVYSYLPHDFMATSGAMKDAATDDAIHVYETSAIQRFTNGTWSPNYTVDDLWATFYNGIRAANFYLIETEGQTFEDWKNSDNYDQWMKNFGNFKYEVRFLRAYYYFELAIRYQNVPLVKEVLDMGQVNSAAVSDFKTILDFVISECAEIATELPINYLGFADQETGRVTKGTALALKSRATLYLASPLYSADSKDLWKAAASAAYEIIGKASDFGYQLTNYATLFGAENNTNAENIFVRPVGESTSFESSNYPMGAEGGKTSTCPTDNLVNCYEMKDGTTFDWNNPAMKANPYENRDPRLAFTIAYNNMTWPYNTSLEIWEGGANGLPLPNATTTGYYLKKYVNNTIDFRPGQSATAKHHNWILFRYAEILLNYAEAMVNAFADPAYTDAQFPISALEAVNMVRARADVNMPPLSNLSAADFMKRLKNERRVELAFEGHRFWDMRRWKDLDDNSTIYGVKVLKTTDGFEYTRFVHSTRVMDDKMYFYPISNTELYKNSNLKQNLGW